jgi:hypothetical protein
MVLAQSLTPREANKKTRDRSGTRQLEDHAKALLDNRR